jgi:hypothetical protein
MLPTTHFAPKPHKLSAGSMLASTPLISVTALAGVSNLVRGAFGERVLRGANHAAMLDVEAIEDQNCFIPHITMATFVDAVAKLSGEEHFGLIVAPHLTIASKGCWGEYMLGAPTLGTAIRRGIATIGFHSRGDVMSLAVDNGEARLSYGSAAKGKGRLRPCGGRHSRHPFEYLQSLSSGTVATVAHRAGYCPTKKYSRIRRRVRMSRCFRCNRHICLPRRSLAA